MQRARNLFQDSLKPGNCRLTKPCGSMIRTGSHQGTSHPVHVSVIGGASIQYSDSLALRLRLSAHALRWLGRAEGGEDGMGEWGIVSQISTTASSSSEAGSGRGRVNNMSTSEGSREEACRSLVIVLREYKDWLKGSPQVT